MSKRTKVNCEVCKSFNHTTEQHEKAGGKKVMYLKNSRGWLVIPKKS